MLSLNCSTGIVESPDPGIVKVTLRANAADTLIIITGDTLITVDGDSYHVKIYQGKAYTQDSIFAILYQNTSEYYEVEHNYNLLKRENGIYKEYTIFESFLPPDNYGKIRFGMIAYFLLLTRGYAYGGIGIPMETPPGTSPFIEFPINFTIEENRITEIKLEIKPLQSVVRYKDIFHFVANMEVISVGSPY
ncbi:hypothetical protein JXO59_00645 [candidate division KSB1 bacterium]|nr:hypothetical protein [candidate division KSB1 bacterium]